MQFWSISACALRPARGASAVALSISLLLVLLIIVLVLLRQKLIKPIPALVCALLGFEAAASRAAPTISHGISNVAQMISSIHI
jgi:hypothetical protein